MSYVNRSLGWIEIRHLAVAPVSLVLLLMYWFIMTIHFRVFNENTPWPIYYALGVPFLIFDILYNAICGTFIFLELPKESLFTSRVERHRQSPYHGPREYATFVCKVLDVWHPGHCKD